MAWVDPTNVATGDVLTASKWNQDVVANGLNLRALANVVQDVETAASSSTLATNTYTSDLLAVTITPTFTTSQVLITCTMAMQNEAGVSLFATLFRNGSALTEATGDAAGSRSRVTTGMTPGNPAGFQPITFQYLDSPATTSATTYSVRVRHGSSITRTYYFNRSESDSDSAYWARSASFLTAQEIPA